MFSGHPNTRNALYLQPPQTPAAAFLWGTESRHCLKFRLDFMPWQKRAAKRAALPFKPPLIWPDTAETAVKRTATAVQNAAQMALKRKNSGKKCGYSRPFCRTFAGFGPKIRSLMRRQPYQKPYSLRKSRRNPAVPDVCWNK